MRFCLEFEVVHQALTLVEVQGRQWELRLHPAAKALQPLADIPVQL